MATIKQWKWIYAVGLASLCTVAVAQDLPKSGTIKFHTGFKVTGESMDVAAKRTQGHGSSLGVTFNDQGSGPLHGGPASCFWTFFVNDDSVRNKGYCAFGDPDGDRVFVDWSGTASADGPHGVLQVVGGTGKYTGIRGSGEWSCKDVGPNGQQNCAQRFEYQIAQQ
jgi:hypothetical protein